MLAKFPSSSRPPIPGEFRLACVRCSRRLDPKDVAFSCAGNALVHVASTLASRPGELVICGGRVVADAARNLILRPGIIVRARATRSRAVHHVRLGEPVSLRAGSWEGTALCGRLPAPARPYWLPLTHQEMDDQTPQACQACEGAFAKLPQRSRS